MLQFMGSQRIRHDLVTEKQQHNIIYVYFKIKLIKFLIKHILMVIKIYLQRYTYIRNDSSICNQNLLEIVHKYFYI